MADTHRKTPAARLAARYERICVQLDVQLKTGAKRTTDPVARMATICALLHAKLPHFFWTGFYRLVDGDLVVGPYQGPLACALLPPPDGVCWAGINGGRTIIVPDVHAFPGHVACDARSRSEIVVPVRDPRGRVVAVLDVDAEQPNAFGEVDQVGLEAVAALVMDGTLR